jgi:8-oxo-dGTP pyrophosphatase MutT (NUDIX family)
LLQRPTIHQAGAVPFRHGRHGEIELLLVTASSGGRWVFPKGGLKPGQTTEEAAAQEALEEAGVVGRVHSPAIGRYRYEKRGVVHEVAMHLLHARQVLPRWPEGTMRRRMWLPAEEALRVQGRPEAAAALEEAVQILRALRHPEPAIFAAYLGH